MSSRLTKLIILVFLVIIFFHFPFPVQAYRVGVNYHQTGHDINTTSFIRQYHKPGVRDLVKKQLQDMVDAGAQVINTRLWLTDPDPNSFPDVYQRLEFPLTAQDLANIRQYVQDVALIKTSEGKPLDLYLTLLWQGCAAYSGGYAEWCELSWDQYVYYAKYTIDQFFTAISGLTRSDGKKAVQLAYFDGELIIEKTNTDKMLSQVYPYFVAAAQKAGIAPTLYFMANRDGTLDRFIIPTIDFMKNNNLYIPSRIDISFYPIPGYPQARYNTGYGPLVDSTFARLQAAYPGHTFAIAETYYPSSSTVRREFGLAFANAAVKYGTLEELLIWPDYNDDDTAWEAPQPYDISSYRLTPTGTISASPNPCTVSTNGTCTSTISWSSINASQPSIYVDGNLFAQGSGSSGSKNTWAIPAGTSYTFTLYNEPGGVVLSSVVIGAVSTSNSNTVSECLCNADDTCSSVCVFDKFSTSITYVNPIKCRLDSNIFQGVLSEKNKDDWCKNTKKTKGDADNSGQVNLMDYYYYVSVKAGQKIPVTVNSDFDGSGIIDTNDRTIIIKSLKP